MSDFIHLHNHSEYSLLDGMAKIPDLVAKAVANEMSALALTDHGVMYGTIPFYTECRKQGIKPIIGCEMYVSPRTLHDKENDKDRGPSHLVLLVENETGYQNLLKLVTIAHLEGFYYKPRIDWEVLTKYHEGLIALSACLNGIVMRPLMREQYDEAENKAKQYAQLFGPDRF